MQLKNSLVCYMLDWGYFVFVIFWVNLISDYVDKDFVDYMKFGLLVVFDVICDIICEEKVNIFGFCIGGILVMVMLVYFVVIGDDWVNFVMILVIMVDFKDVGEIGVFVDENWLEVLCVYMEEKGYFEVYYLQDMFLMFCENDLIWLFFEVNYLCGWKFWVFDFLYWNLDFI